MSDQTIFRARSPARRENVAFLTALVRDLRAVGLRAWTVLRPGAIRFGVTMPKDGHLMAEAFDAVRQRCLAENARFIRAAESTWLSQIALRAADIEFDRIAPVIKICQTRRELSLYRYARLLQRVPNGPRRGRQIYALIYDSGQTQPYIMGAIGLASPLYSVRDRDAFFGWNASTRQRQKHAGLDRMMDLAVCVAVPPYNLLHGAKLAAALASSDEIGCVFRRKYKRSLLAITTTAANGMHSPIFNRIMLLPGGLYKRIGQTTGYSTVPFSVATLSAARRLVTARRKVSNGDISHWNTMRILKNAGTLCGFSSDALMRLGCQKGLYLAVPDPTAIASLKKGLERRRDSDLSAARIIEYWKDKILAKCRQDPERSLRFRAYCDASVRLSQLLREGRLQQRS